MNILKEYDHINERELWLEYNKSNDHSARLKIIDKYIKDVKIIVATMYKLRGTNAVDYNDYYQFAFVGLLEAINSYNYKLKNNFITYAQYRIKGAILNGLAKMTEKASQIKQQNIFQQRIMSLHESNEETNNLFKDIVDLSISLSIGVLLERNEDEDLHLSEYGSYEISELREMLGVCIDRLSSEERMVIMYHYYYEVEFSTISEIMGLTKGRVSQIHKKALQDIRDIYDHDLQLDTYY